jgi:hypothetical protein
MLDKHFFGRLINDISYLKKNYRVNSNIYKLTVKDISIEDFQKLIDKFIECKNKKDLVDNKEYLINNLKMSVTNDGDIRVKARKSLKYKQYNENIVLELYNEKNIPVENFYGLTEYDQIYKQKKIILQKTENISMSLIVKMVDKELHYEVIIKMKSIENENLLNEFLDFF